MREEYSVDLSAILGEFRLLVAVSGLLFGFILSVSAFRRIELLRIDTASRLCANRNGTTFHLYYPPSTI